jgi:diguanylate cyclase (GGDEF)-like protein/PAS domain S-box-containing protein
MSFQFHPYVTVLLISALTTLITSILVARHEVPGSTALGGVLLGSFVWSSAYALTWSFTELNEKVLWLKIMYFGVIAIPPLFLIFALQITHHETWLTARTVVALCVMPVIMLTFVWFDIRFLFPTLELRQVDDLRVLQIERGPGFWLNTFYSYAIILLAFYFLVRSSLKATPFYRRQYLTILIGSLVPFLASALTQLSYKELADLDMAPISVGISGIIYVYAILRYQFMDLVPVARELLIESMSDGVLVLDVQGRIVDINPAMKDFLAIEPGSLIGYPIAEVMHSWAYSLELLLSGMETHTEIRLPGKPSRYLDLRITLLYDDHNKLSGRLIVFRDVTDRKAVEKDLRRAMDRLQNQLIEIGTLQSKLREQAIRDALTNLFNRRYLEETLERELSRAERESYPLCVIMMDLDYFKEVNDTYGHEAGDVVLKTLADTAVQQSRHGDFVCRYGGEEFVVVMPNIGIETAKRRADELHQTINALNIPYGVFNLTTTISMGVAAYPDHGGTKEELIRAADRALYVAKNTGRNRVVVYTEPELSTE